jgi:hypothetical protein
MCDETAVVTRREFTAMGAAVLAGFAWSEAHALEAGLSEKMVEVKTADGTCEAFFVHPAGGKHPGVVFWPDAIGLRDTKKAMARRLAAEGYAVLVVNQYYRTHKLPIGIDHLAGLTAKIGLDGGDLAVLDPDIEVFATIGQGGIGDFQLEHFSSSNNSVDLILRCAAERSLEGRGRGTVLLCARPRGSRPLRGTSP